MRTRTAGVFFGSMLICGYVVLFIMNACTRQEARTAADAALTIGQLICLETQPSSNAEIAQATCHVISNPVTRDVITKLLSQRDSARRMGFVWTGPSSDTAGDASSDAKP